MAKKEAVKHDNKQEIIESLSINERKILPFITDSFNEICNKSGMEEVAVLRALEYLTNKSIIKLKVESKKLIELGVNGVLYKQKGLPERRLAEAISQKAGLTLQEAQKISNLSNNEFQAALGALKKKALASLKEGKLLFTGTKEELSRKSLEEQLIEKLPLELNKLAPEEKFALDALKNRKNIIEITGKNKIEIELLPLGKEILKDADKISKEAGSMIEAMTPEVLLSGSWRGKKFRRYDVSSPVPKISGGKRHFVNQATDYARKIWSELGFKEMSGTMCQTGFWNFDALFTAQDHPVREIQDTFYIKDVQGKLPDKKLVSAVKESHENGGKTGSVGWKYEWKEEPAKKVILRTHTTALSSNTLAALKKEDLPAKFFAVGKCFRNETVDWGHLFEFNQTEGIAIGEDVNFAQLLGYLKEFAKKMGYEKVKFQPSYFPYTEPSVEGYVWNEERKQWIEVLAAGIFRPEVTAPLLGKPIPVLAWGPGFDRMMMSLYNIKDLRELYENNLTKLREMKFWNEK